MLVARDAHLEQGGGHAHRPEEELARQTNRLVRRGHVVRLAHAPDVAAVARKHGSRALVQHVLHPGGRQDREPLSMRDVIEG